MFSKAKRDKSTVELPEDVQGDATMLDGKNTAQRGKTTRQSGTGGFGVPSLISGDMVIKGEISSEGEVQFDGQLEGDINAKGIVIGEGATVRGEVVAEKVKVAGTIVGKIRATRVELTSSATVDGDILHTALMIEAGARFDGSCRHSDDPVGQSATGKSAVSSPMGDSAPQPSLEGRNVPREREAKLREATGAAPATDDLPKGDAAPVQQLRQAANAKKTASGTGSLR